MRLGTASHVGNTGSSPVGTTNNNNKGLDEFLSPLFFAIKLFPTAFPTLETLLDPSLSFSRNRHFGFGSVSIFNIH